MCQCHSTRPQPIQLVPTMQKKALYVIISAEIPENLVHKSCCLTVIFDEAADFLFSPCQVVPGACLSQIVTNSHTSNTHKRPQTPTNTHKEWSYHTFVKEWMKALDKTGILAPSDYFYHFSFPSYGRLKSKTNFSNVFLRPCSLIPLMHCS